jgi:hypothetical protein
MTDRKKSGVAFWATVVVVVLVAYPLSLGPACWISSRLGWGATMVSLIYEPLVFDSPAFARPVAHAYSRLGAADGWHWRHVSGGWSNLPYPGSK